MDPLAADFQKYVDQTIAFMERVPVSAEQASKRIAIDVGLDVRSTARLREAVIARAYPGQ